MSVTQRSYKLMLVAGVLVASAALTGCNEAGEQDDLAQAQSCLDAVPGNDPARAEACLSFAAPYSSTRANALKCSIYMTAGGLIDDKIVKAYKALKSTTDNKEATFMAALSLSLPTVAIAYDRAVSGNAFCQISGSPGMMYIGSAVVAGTYLNKVIASVNGGAGVDMNDPDSVKTAVENMLTDCTSPAPSPACTSDLPTLGATTIALSDAYCGGKSPDQNVCDTIEQAIASANSDPAKVGKALFCYLDKKTYDATSGQCL